MDETTMVERHEEGSPVPAGQGLDYDVDIVLCIDATGSMAPVIETVKARAVQLPDDLMEEMRRKGKHVSNLRIKVIAYRDIFHDADPFSESDFFSMPDERSRLQAFVSTISADGGGDEPESGLEAVALALRSEWANRAPKRRHLVVVFTDASSHPIEHNAGRLPAAYADQIPSTMGELIDLWDGAQTSQLSRAGRRLVLFAPEATPWPDIQEDWEQVLHFPSQAGEGLADFEYDEILDLISQSV